MESDINIVHQPKMYPKTADAISIVSHKATDETQKVADVDENIPT